MSAAARGPKGPNDKLLRLITASGVSHKHLARRVNELAVRKGIATKYVHTSVLNWADRGMTPRHPVPSLIAEALGEHLGRAVTAEDIGMGTRAVSDPDIGLHFPRDPTDAVLGAADFWSDVDRRDVLGFAVSAYAMPVTRWLVQPADTAAARASGRRVGRTDITSLWKAVSQAQRWDSKYGGGSRKASSATTCLTERAAPLLRGAYNEATGRELCTVTAELARVAAWTAVDMGHHDTAQRHFVQALRLARAGGAVDMGCYVLSTMALQTVLRGYPNEAVDMAQGAYERAKNTAPRRVLAFAKLMEARGHAKTGDERAATAALIASEALLDRARDDSDEPHWIANVTPARLAADATEIYRDLRLPSAALMWNGRADAMSADAYTRSVGLRLTATATAYLHARELEQAITVAGKAVDLIATVHSARARGYVDAFTDELAEWRAEPLAIDFARHAQTRLASTPTAPA
ncbi:sporulation protein [Streptomyces sp. NBC_00838]|uniref:sporulation protein n=1 Tax=Streptomyces sp. NBC_00838 TaxID=2903680 RepID=UPI00386BBB41|nr:sporulation protein [Streptomyces sp. NBC_00838]